MGAIKIVAKQKVQDNQIIIDLPSEPYKSQVMHVLNLCNEKCGGYCSVQINRPYKPRTTGEGSQNNLTWKLITIVANEMGEEVETVENLAKKKAISKGYPYKEVMGEVVPASMRTINTLENSYLIDTLYEMVAFLGIELEPELVKEEPVFDEKANEETMKALGMEYEEEEYQGDIF